MTNCPNCGAPITSYECEYCGTVFEDPLENIRRLESKTKDLQYSLYAKYLYVEAIKAMRPYNGVV